MKIQRPVRATRAWVQHLHAPPSHVFPLLCPVREREWVDGWDPRVVISESGVAEPECVFVTADAHGESTWVAIEHDPSRFVVRFVKTTPALAVTRVDIRLEPEGAGTAAHVTYSWTALSEAGAAFVRDRTDEWWSGFMAEWEGSLNRFLDRQH
ncbi:MAG TPA: hypothetical protein VFX12_04660 [Vicinamibacterales bacterium]|nr:hypothetical protein [Vicinamibacterales bacterium]